MGGLRAVAVTLDSASIPRFRHEKGRSIGHASERVSPPFDAGEVEGVRQHTEQLVTAPERANIGLFTELCGEVGVLAMPLVPDLLEHQDGGRFVGDERRDHRLGLHGAEVVGVPLVTGLSHGRGRLEIEEHRGADVRRCDGWRPHLGVFTTHEHYQGQKPEGVDLHGIPTPLESYHDSSCSFPWIFAPLRPVR